MHVPIRSKVVVITGGSRGIGLAAAQRLGREGARLALIARDESTLQAAKERVAAEGAEVRTYPLDLRSESDLSAAASRVLSDFGKVDALVNNAAVGVYGKFLDLTMDDWRSQVEINVLGLVAVTRAFLPAMLERAQGHILNVASVQGLRTSPSSSAYSATKFAVMGITDSLAQEMQGHGIRVSVLCPGGVATDFAGFPASDKEDWLTPDDVAIVIQQMLETGGRAVLRQSLLLPFPD